MIYKTVKNFEQNPDKIKNIKVNIAKKTETVSYLVTKVIYLNEINNFINYIDKNQLENLQNLKSSLINRYTNLLTNNHYNLENLKIKEINQLKNILTYSPRLKSG